MMLIGAAGPAANLVCAVISALLWRFASQSPYAEFIFRPFITVNVCLAVFNLIPIPPLDGSRIVAGLLPAPLARGYASLEPYGFLILLALMFFNILDWVIWPAVEALLRAIFALYLA
jgi:Zn-dependent protease